jgi:5-methyltetrahydrofolate--homocysteine methyltransferase
MEHEGVRVPLMISATLTENGRTLSGQTLEAFVASISHCDPLSIGLNCGFGADTMTPHIEALQSIPYAVSMHANAGLPNEMGEYDETPETMASKIKPLLDKGMINIIGGCCGTTPAHISTIADIVKEKKGKSVKEKSLTPQPSTLNSQFSTLNS